MVLESLSLSFNLEKKLESLLQSAQFVKEDATTDEVILKTENELNKELLAMNKRDVISDQLYSKMRSTGGNPPVCTV